MAKRQLTFAEVFAVRAKRVCANESLITRARLYKVHFVAKRAESTNVVLNDNSDRHTITATQNRPTLECLPEPDLAPWPERFGGEPG